MKNSKHSYERLNWNKDLYKPIIRTNTLDHSTIVLEYNKNDSIPVIDNKKFNDHICPGVVVLGPTTPKCNNLLNEQFEPKDIINNYYLKIKNFIGRNLKLKKKLYSCTFLVPPDEKIRAHREKVLYGLQNIDVQLRFLKNKINYLIHDLEITDYVYLFEITAAGIVHCHAIFQYDNYYSIIRNTFCNIMCYKSWKKVTTNCNIKEDVDEGLAEYLCKIYTPCSTT